MNFRKFLGLGKSPKSPKSSSSAAKEETLQAVQESPRRRKSRELELESVFQFMDSNNDGRISIDELYAVLRALGDDPSEEDMQRMVREVDSDGDGFISLDEFLRFNASSAASNAELEAAFRVFDIDRNGYITPDELHKVLVSLGDKSLTREDCGRMIRGVDADGDGLVDFEEFKVMMMATA